MLNLEKFTNLSNEIIASALNFSAQYKNSEIQPEHILLACVKDDGMAKDYMQELKLLNQDFINDLMSAIKSFPTVSMVNTAQLILSKDSFRILEQAQELSQEFKDEFVGLDMILLAMTKVEDTNVFNLLQKYKVSANTILNAMKKIRGNNKVDNKNAEENLKALEKYSTDLTALARKGKLDPVIGRDDEIRRIVQVLNRRTKNNPVLIGEPGVGKTAIIEGLAQRIVRGDVPESLKNVKLVSLDLGAIIAGAKYKGEFEERLKAVLKEVENSNGEIVMFIDELHMVVGAGASDGADGCRKPFKTNACTRSFANNRRNNNQRVPQIH